MLPPCSTRQRVIKRQRAGGAAPHVQRTRTRPSRHAPKYSTLIQIVGRMKRADGVWRLPLQTTRVGGWRGGSGSGSGSTRQRRAGSGGQQKSAAHRCMDNTIAVRITTNVSHTRAAPRRARAYAALIFFRCRQLAHHARNGRRGGGQLQPATARTIARATC